MNINFLTTSGFSSRVAALLIIVLIQLPAISPAIDFGSSGYRDLTYTNPLVVFSNPAAITITDRDNNTNPGGTVGISSPYPSAINVTGLAGTVSDVNVTITGFSADRPRDINIVLVAPTGQALMLLADAGGLVSTVAAPINITIDDAAAAVAPEATALATGSYRPTDHLFSATDRDDFPSPGPGSVNNPAPEGAATLASVFNGVSPNGNWNLFIIDDSLGGGNSSITGGWSIDITTAGGVEATSTSVVSNLNPALTGQTITFTSTTINSTTMAGVTTGTVTFTNNGVNIAGCVGVAVIGAGQATCMTTLAEGTRTIAANYSGTAALGASSGSVTQVVNSPTVVAGAQFCNNGGLTITDAGTSAPVYPSTITVSNLFGTISKVTAQINGFTSPRPSNIDFLLVGANNAGFTFMSDAGDAVNPAVNLNFTFDDPAASAMPQNTALGSGTFRPTDYAVAADSDPFPAPAPAMFSRPAPAGASTFASVYNTSDPNGNWRLFAVDDGIGGGNSTVSSWCLNFTITPFATTTVVTSSVNPSLFGQSVTFTATVSSGAGTPTGTVTFFDGMTQIGGPVALNGAGQATVNTSALTVGNHTITAQYSGATVGAGGGGFAVSSGALAGGQTVSGTAVWDGSASSDWHTAANWTTNFVPAAATLNVDIPAAGVTNNPAISSADVTVANVSIGGTRTLTVGAARTLNATGVVSLGTGRVIGLGTLSLGTAATITHGAGGQVESTLRKNFAGPGPVFEMPVGTPGAFSPLNVTVTAGAGQLTTRANTGMPVISPVPLDPARTLQRYWTLSGSGIRSNITFNYLNGDVPGPPNDENIWGIIRVTGNVAVGYPDSLPYVTMDAANNRFTITDLESYSHWTAGELLAPTAANAEVSGRVVDLEGRGIYGARVAMQNQEGEVVWAITNPFGYYRFTGVETGQSYLVSVGHKRYVFESRTVNLNEDLTDLDFVPQAESGPDEDRQPVKSMKNPR